MKERNERKKENADTKITELKVNWRKRVQEEYEMRRKLETGNFWREREEKKEKEIRNQ